MRHVASLIPILALALALACAPVHADDPDDAVPASTSAATDPAVVACKGFIGGLEQNNELHKDLAGWKTRLPMPPMFEFDPDSDYFWDLTTNKGEIRIRLMPDVAPMHVSSTMYLTELGFYDGLTFHRVIPDFMAQGGCPLGNGMGGPGYKYASEFDPKVRHDRPGLLSMANTGRPSTDGSQFFITFVPTPHLDGKHTIFGEVVEGMATVRKLEASASKQDSTPREPLIIERAAIAVEPKAPAGG